MAITLEERARRAISRRRERSKDDRIVVRLERTSPRTGVPLTPAVGWMTDHSRVAGSVWEKVGDVHLLVDLRLARYAASHAVVLTAWRIGPFERLVPADPYLMLRLVEWESSRARPETPDTARAVHQRGQENRPELPGLVTGVAGVEHEAS